MLIKMVDQKRGIFLVVLAVFLILNALSAFALNLNEKKAIGVFVNIADDDDCVGDHDVTSILTEGASFSKGDCSWDWNVPPEEGCVALFREDDSGNAYTCLGLCDPDEDDCSDKYAEPGKIISAYTYSDLGFSHSDACPEQPIRMGATNTLLCSEDHYWHQCTATKDDDLGTIAWAGNSLYNCTLDENDQPFWQSISGTDIDHDGIPAPQDCRDFPDEPQLTPKSQCPTTPDTCSSSLKYSKCAICIHPGAKEVCGDGIDNDCDPETSDLCDENKDACENNGQTNIHGQAFSWLQTGPSKKDGYCCGFRGIEDLGLTKNSALGEGNFLCLNKNPALVGRDGEIPGWGSLTTSPTSENPSPATTCSGDWCWVNAVGPAKFKVLTVKPFGKEAHDFVSNNERWFECKKDAKTALEQPLMDGSELVSYPKVANRFSCYQEGNHWNWAECYGKNDDAKNKDTIKGRYAGEGQYSLFLDGADAEGEKYGNTIFINTQNGKYGAFYGPEATFDFSGYGYLEFMIKFVADANGGFIAAEDLDLPTNVFLEIYGPDQTDLSGNTQHFLYFNQSILGYATNGPFFSGDNWVHVKVPISSFLQVQQIVIKSQPEANLIGIKNVYLSKENEKPKLCSGEDSRDYSSWITDVDQAVPGNPITGEELCSMLYGPQAWLGGIGEVDYASAHCCGNNKNEYYAGTSSNNHGCWNSLVVAPNQTIMNVEVKIGYSEKQPKLTYPELPLTLNLVTQGVEVRCPEEIKDWNAKAYGGTCDSAEADSYCHGQVRGSCFGLPENKKKYSYLWCDTNKNLPDALCTDFLANDCIYSDTAIEKECAVESNNPEAKEITKTIYNTNAQDPEISLLTSPKKIWTLKYPEQEIENDFKIKKYILEKTSDEMIPSAYFYSPLGENLGTEVTLDQLKYLGSVSVFAETQKIKVESSEPSPKSQSLTYSCSEDECLYPLPGEPPYTITNLHPDLYELYFIAKDKDGQVVEKLVTSEKNKFNVPGNLKVKRVAQQVLYFNDGQEKGFFGCQAAGYLEGKNKVLPENNLPYCSIKSERSCAYSVSHKSSQNPNDFYTTISSWSNASLTSWGYQEATEPPPAGTELPLETGIKKAEELNHSSVVLPGRNFVPNAGFTTQATEVPHWDLFDNNVPVTDEENLVSEGVITLGKSSLLLRSEKIAVGENMKLSYSQELSCPKTKVLLVDKEGKSTEINNPAQFNTGQVSFLILEYSGSGCQVQLPSLQVVDALGPVNSSSSYDYPEYMERAGAACCPENWCWNGYVCVKEMSALTYLTEIVAPNREYRCIDGTWEYLPKKMDWNGEKSGFCSQESQCFVLGSDAGAKAEYTAADFLSGHYPVCINSGEFILDHYCDSGNWTSRTKYLASKLLEVGENDEYVLYCTNYRQALLQYSGQENYLGGGITMAPNESSSTPLGAAAPEVPEQLSTCFSSLQDPEGKRLVKDAENACINNVCLLKYKEGGEFKVALATSLNLPLNDSNSFLVALNVPQEKLASLCSSSGSESNDFLECELAGLSDLTGNLWYSPPLNALIYGKQGISLGPSLTDKIFGWLGSLFGVEKELSPENKFVTSTQNFRELYLLSTESKKVRAVRENCLPQQDLVAEYEGFTTPVCDYVDHLQTPLELGSELLEQAMGIEKLTCSANESIQRVEALVSPDAARGLDFLWPQLTGQLRVGN